MKRGPSQLYCGFVAACFARFCHCTSRSGRYRRWLRNCAEPPPSSGEKGVKRAMRGMLGFVSRR